MFRAVVALILFLSAPAWAQAPDAARRASLDRLLDALKSAPSPETAGMLEAHIEGLWLQAGTPAVRLLISRGLREMKAGAVQEAVQDFGDAIALDPNMEAAWRERAAARFAAGDAAGAVADLSQAVKLEPRDFAAYKMLAAIAESRQDWKAAYGAWQNVQQIDPKTPGGDQRLKMLRRKALGLET